MKRIGSVGLLFLVLLVHRPAGAGSFEDSLRARWRGAWVLLQVESYSTCAGTYFNNDVSGSFVASRGGRRFDPGELAKVDRVQINRKKVELMVTIPTPVLIPRNDGPFTLYDERPCAIELEVAIPREVIKAKEVDRIDALLAQVALRFSTEEAALNSAEWNGREADAYPPDYGLTLVRHAVWHAEQTNIAIDRRIELAVEQAEDLAEQVDDDPSYLDGFAAGTRQMRAWNESACERLLAADFGRLRHRAPEDRADDHRWCEGFSDGQELVYSLGVARRLPGCYVEIPPAPGE